jgi:hypothetical protein
MVVVAAAGVARSAWLKATRPERAGSK